MLTGITQPELMAARFGWSVAVSFGAGQVCVWSGEPCRRENGNFSGQSCRREHYISANDEPSSQQTGAAIA
jgi:hypothetical protein